MSDFHYIELWYKAESPRVYIHWDFVFHTILISKDLKEVEIINKIIDILSRPRIFVSPSNYKRFVKLENQLKFFVSRKQKFYTKEHSQKTLRKYFSNKMLSKACSKMPWDHIRYFSYEEFQPRK